MRQDQQNVKVNETNRNKRMANMMAIFKQATATTTSLVDTTVDVSKLFDSGDEEKKKEPSTIPSTIQSTIQSEQKLPVG